jgi:hypothetical protein
MHEFNQIKKDKPLPPPPLLPCNTLQVTPLERIISLEDSKLTKLDWRTMSVWKTN